MVDEGDYVSKKGTEAVAARRVVYLDHAATTPLHPHALEAMLPYFSQKYGNPSTLYSLGQEARQAVEEARTTVADILGCSRREIIFTGGGTESDNAALKGSAFAVSTGGGHIIASAVEHDAVIETCHFLDGFGFEVTYLPVDSYGMVDLQNLEGTITEKTILVSVMLANNEVGTIQPVADIARLVKEKQRFHKRRIVFHTDAVQGVGALDLNVNKLEVDMLSLSAHKFGGPKGVGILYLRKGVPFLPQQSGGAQESKRRAGTENVAGIVGTAVAMKLASESRDENSRHCRKLRDRLIEGIKSRIERAYLTGHPTLRLPNHASFCFEYVEGEPVLLHLDSADIAVSSGSACTSGSLEASHVLLAMGISPNLARGSVRFTFGCENTEQDVDYVLSLLPGIIERLRAISPFAAAAEDKEGVLH